MDWLLSPWAIFGAGFSVTAVFAALWFLAPGLVPALLSTKLGRRVAVIGAVIFAIWIAFASVFKRGQNSVHKKIEQDSIKKDEKREQRDAELKKLDDAALRKRSDRWLSDK
jgi:type VI protein secretion system component VasK